MAQVPPYIFFNFKGFADKIRMSGKRSGPDMNPTISQLHDELNGIARAANATLAAVDVLQGMLRLHKMEMEFSCATEEDIIKSLCAAKLKEENNG